WRGGHGWFHEAEETRKLRRFGRLTDGSVAIHEGFPGTWGAGRPGDEPGILAVADHPRRRPARCPEAAATDAEGPRSRDDDRRLRGRRPSTDIQPQASWSPPGSPSSGGSSPRCRRA